MSHTERSISPIGSLKLDVPSASTVSTLKELNARRSSVKGRITKYKNLFNKISETQPTLQVDLCMLNQRYESLREMFSKFDELQTQIEIMNTANLEAELDIRDDIETDFSSLIAKTQLFLEANQTQREDFRPANSEICSNCSNPSQHISGFKLPTIKIANFDGTYFKWLEFRDTFTSLIHSNNRIESVHKFHYLNSYLEGEAAHVISNLEVSSANYDEAWKLLCERYNNEKQLISNHLNSLCNLQPVSRDSSKDLKFLIDHISKNLRALNTLGEPTASWDTLVIHLVTSKLDSSTNFKWEEHRSNFKRSPSLKDFFCFLKARANILESIQLNRTERASINKRPLNSFDLSKGQRPQTRSFVISAGQSSSSSTSICVLCGGDHRLYDCATFLAKSIADRTAEVGITWGKAFLVAAENSVALPYLTKRECKLGGYKTCVVNFHPTPFLPATRADKKDALLYIALPENKHWLGSAPLPDIAKQILECRGPSGSNVEYLLRLADFMREEIPEALDDHLFSLERLVRKFAADFKICLRSLVGEQEREEREVKVAVPSNQFASRIPEKKLRCVNM